MGTDLPITDQLQFIFKYVLPTQQSACMHVTIKQ